MADGNSASFKSTGWNCVAGNVAEMSQGLQGTLSPEGWYGRPEGERGGGGGGDGREEGGRGAFALRRPFGRPSCDPSGALVVLVRYLCRTVYQSFRGPLPAQSCGKGARLRTTVAGKDGDDLQRVWYSLSFLYVWFGPCQLDSEESHPCGKKSPKRKPTHRSAHHSFRTHHAALD